MDFNIKEIAKKIKSKGGNLYLVGGAVRDEIIGIDAHDEDYCVTGLSKEEFISLFPNYYPRGKSFEVFDIDGREFALARTEKKSGKGHKAFEVYTAKSITIEEDLMRRDITINSIAKNILTGDIIDPYNGQADIKSGIIRATSEAFLDDPLRAYRAARFACKLGFKIEPNTIKMMEALKPELNELSAERVFDELRKALSFEKPSIFFRALKDANILDVHFIELYKLIGALQPEDKHPEGDSFEHTMCAVDRCATKTDDVVIRFAVLVHDLGKGVTPKEEYPHHYMHDVNGVQEVKNLCARLKVPSFWCSCGKTSAREHMRAGIFGRMTPGKKVEFIERLYKSKLGLKALEIIVDADKNCRGTDSRIVKFADLGEHLMTSINGKELDMDDGLKIKQKLHQMRVLELKKMNNE